MTAAFVSVLLAINQAPPPPSHHDPFRGSQESVAPPRRSTSGGMTLEALHGLPLTRPTMSSQPQVWVYQPNYWVYPTNSPGLGGYLPPGVGNYRLGMYWWGW